MILEHLRIAARVFARNKAHAAINILGLSVGIAATVMMLSYIRFELGYDGFHDRGEDIYRVSIRSFKEGTLTGESPVFTAPLGPALKDEFPEVENFVRISTPRTVYASRGGDAYRLDGVLFADSTFFEMFSFRLAAGDRERALAAPRSIVLTGEWAAALFGTEDPIGRSVTINGRDLYTVTGVAEQPAANSHIRFGALCSFSTLYGDPNLFMDWDGGNQYIAYVRLLPVKGRSAPAATAPAASLAAGLEPFLWRHINSALSTVNVKYEASLQPLGDIHLHYEPDSGTTRANLVVFAIVAAFILLVACVNYINLAIARAARRGKEVGIRKVLGADRGAIIRQFLAESFLLTFVASLAALLIVELGFPVFTELLGARASGIDPFGSGGIVLSASVFLLVGVAAGGYPAFYLSALRPADTLKGGASAGRGKRTLSNVLVTLQFAVSIALIACTIVVGRQVAYLNDKDPGFRRDRLLVMRLIGDEAKSRSAVLAAALKQIPGVSAVSASSDVPVEGFTSNGYFPEGYSTPMMIHVVDVDESFLETYGIPLLSGRNFGGPLPAGTPDINSDGILVNETLVRMLDWSDPVGRTIRRDGDHPIRGVVRDFNFSSFHAPVGPLIMTRRPWRGLYDMITVRIAGDDLAGTLSAIRSGWASVLPTAPLHYAFLDEMSLQQYDREERFGTLFSAFSGLAIVIALLGLVSLSSYAAERRTREIGIRKILGASVPGLVGLLSRDFLVWIALANLIAWPAVYLFARAWLEDFAYRVEIGIFPFLLAGLAAFAFGWIVVGLQSARAAMTNPVETLRYE